MVLNNVRFDEVKNNLYIPTPNTIQLRMALVKSRPDYTEEDTDIFPPSLGFQYSVILSIHDTSVNNVCGNDMPGV